MASQLSPRSLVARSTSMGTGQIIGAVVGSVVGTILLILIFLPFILKAIRTRRRPGEDGVAAEMGMAPPALASPTSTRRLSVEQFSPTARQPREGVAGPAKEYDVDGNSYESTPPPPAVNGHASGAHALPRLDVSHSALSALPDGDGMQMDSPLAIDTVGPMPPLSGPASPRSDSSRQRKSSKGSISQAIEDLAGRASAVFRRTSTRSERSAHRASPVRAAPFDLEQDAMDADPTLSPPPQLFRDSEDHTRGAAAEYYSGAPLSPPEAHDFQMPPPAAYGSPEAGMVTTRLVSISAATALAGVQPKRTDSQLSDFSPMSPVSPPIKIEQSFDEDEEFPVGVQSRGVDRVVVVAGDEDDEKKIKSEFPASPVIPSLVPSPPVPAPGTVNPQDVWAPTNKSEHVHQVNAALYHIDHSPSPAPPSPMPTFTPSPEPPEGLQTWAPQTNQPELQPASPEFQLSYSDPYQQSYPLDGYIDFNSQIPPPIIAEPPVTPPQPPVQDADMADVAGGLLTPAPTNASNNSVENTPVVPGRPTSPASNWVSPVPSSNIGSDASPRTFTCDECPRVFDQIHKLNHHKRYHERPHECPHAGCGKKFGTKTHLERHINDKHDKTRKYHCTEHGCPYSKAGGKSFPRKDNWRRHMQNKHGCNPEHDPVEVVMDERMGGM